MVYYSASASSHRWGRKITEAFWFSWFQFCQPYCTSWLTSPIFFLFHSVKGTLFNITPLRFQLRISHQWKSAFNRDTYVKRTLCSAPAMSLTVPVIGKTGIWPKLISNLTSVRIKCLLPIAPKGHNFQSLIDFQSVQDRCPVTMPNSISIAINSEFIKICSYRS